MRWIAKASSTRFWRIDRLAVAVLAVLFATGPSLAEWSALDWARDPVWERHHTCAIAPPRYEDSATRIVLIVEPDGRHLRAVDAHGRRLWRRNPHRGVPDYRVAPPCIVVLDKPRPEREVRAGDYAGLAFDNSQFGLVDLHTGRFVWDGQD